MKKGIYTIIIIFILVLLTSCSLQGTRSNEVESTSLNKSGNSEIEVQTPMTLSNNLCTFNGQPAYLRLKMVKGRYYEDWTPGAYMGTLWEGSFVMELADEFGKTIAETDISKVYTEPLIFKFSFNLEFDDYNNDGDSDFTIGQYASSNGLTYKIFTLRKDGKVEQLPVKDHSDLFISQTKAYYSAKLTKTDNTSFKKAYYDNSAGKYFEDHFQWENGEFVLTKTQEIASEES